MRHSLFTLALAFALSAAPALAQEFKAGDIVVEKPWARATPKGRRGRRRLFDDPKQGRRARPADWGHGGLRHRRDPSDEVGERRVADA